MDHDRFCMVARIFRDMEELDMYKSMMLALMLMLMGSAMTGCEVIYPYHHDRGYHSGHDGGDHDRGREHERKRHHGD